MVSKTGKKSRKNIKNRSGKARNKSNSNLNSVKKDHTDKIANVKATENTMTKKKDENSFIRIIMLIIIIVAIGILIGTVSYTLTKVHEYKEYSRNIISYIEFNSSVEITPHSTGLNADRDGIKFGKTVPGSSGTRFLDINTSEDAFVQIFLSGDLAPYMSVKNNSFNLSAGEYISVPVYLDVPEDAAYGFYEGKVYVLLTKR